ncbi:MAG: VOC family protein [Pseudomonadota bacterium]
MSFTPENPVIWTEIPVADLPKAIRFYEAVFQWTTTMHEDGPNPFAMFPDKGVSGHLYPGKPAKDGGPTVHLQVPDTVEAASDRVRAAGGTVLPIPPITIPAGRFVYATDPDGNSIGLFEPAKDS